MVHFCVQVKMKKIAIEKCNFLLKKVMGIKEGVRLWQIMAKGNQMVKLF